MKVAIIDDEINNRLVIKNIIRTRFPLILIVVEEGAVETAIEKINFEKPDLVFMDIQLKNGTGFNVIDSLEYKPKIIFTTAYSEFAIKAIKIKAFDYLLKPIDDNELIASVKELERLNIAEKLNYKTDTEIGMDFYHYVTHAGKMSVRKSDILFFESSGAYTYIVTENQKLLVSKSIGEIELELKESFFYRIHNSFIVNITKIKNIDIKRGGYITLKNEKVVPISQRKTKSFMDLLGGKKSNY
jgi:two-component system LytT family response regulator